MVLPKDFALTILPSYYYCSGEAESRQIYMAIKEGGSGEVSHLHSILDERVSTHAYINHLPRL